MHAIVQRMILGPDARFDPEVTLPALLDRRAAENPDALLLIDAASGTAHTRREIRDASLKAARGLHRLGFGAGDCLCTLMPNHVSWYVVAVAAHRLGGSISGINPMATPDEIARQFAQVPARAILAATPLLDAARKIAAALSIPIVLSVEPGGAADCIDDLDGPALPAVTPRAEDAALLPFSSGSSGLPKAAIISHRNLICGGVQIPHRLKIRAGDRLLGLAPLFHIVGPHLFPSALQGEAAIVVVGRLDPAFIFDAVEKHRVTHMPLLVPILKVLARHPAGEGRDFSSLKIVAGGGVALDAGAAEDARKRFGCPILQVYGMTETSAIITADAPEDVDAATCGRIAPNMKMRFADPRTGEILPLGEAGEVQLEGPNIFGGYLGLEEATRAAFTEDGWLRTGDIGRLREDGRLLLTGRIKEMIKVHSAQVAPAELEMLLHAHRAVAESVVTGRPSRYCGEAPIAYVVLAEPIDPYEIMDWVNDQVIRYKRLRGIVVVDGIPRNATGKPDRNAVAAMDAAGRSAGVAAGGERAA
ncbi:MAG: AMP-binding protein [Nitratireductor sp.]|nr:AMP-binding protein [Nitratireductor sp.]